LKISKAARIADSARKSIGRYCHSECNAYCCRKGFLMLTAKQAKLVAGEKLNELLKSKGLTPVANGKYVLELAVTCPSLINSKCRIHSHPQRPLTCREFPLSIEGKVIWLSGSCPAVRAQMMYPYLAKLRLMGYKIKNL